MSATSFTAELSEHAGVEGGTEDMARDNTSTTPDHPPRADRRETLDVSPDHDIDIDESKKVHR